MNDRQIGKFSLSIPLVRDRPDLVAEVFSALKLVPVRCECMFGSNAFEYTAISERFPEIQQGMIIPKYCLAIKCDKSDGVELVEVIPYGVGRYTEIFT